MKQLWRCPAGHELPSPDDVKYKAVVCGICARQDGPRPNITTNIKVWSMTLVRGPKG